MQFTEAPCPKVLATCIWGNIVNTIRSAAIVAACSMAGGAILAFLSLWLPSYTSDARSQCHAMANDVLYQQEHVETHCGATDFLFGSHWTLLVPAAGFLLYGMYVLWQIARITHR